MASRSKTTAYMSVSPHSPEGGAMPYGASPPYSFNDPPPAPATRICGPPSRAGASSLTVSPSGIASRASAYARGGVGRVTQMGDAGVEFTDELVTSIPIVRKDRPDRHCVDQHFVIIFLVLFALAAAFAVAGFLNGVPQRLYRGASSNGKVCGYDSGVERLPFLYYPLDPARSSLYLLQDSAVCVQRCPSADDVKLKKSVPLSRVVKETDAGRSSAVLMEFSVLSPAYATTSVSNAFCMPLEPTLRRQWRPWGAHPSYYSSVQARYGALAKAVGVATSTVFFAVVASIVLSQIIKFAPGIVLLGPCYVCVMAVTLGFSYLWWSLRGQLEGDWQRYPFQAADSAWGMASGLGLLVAALIFGLVCYIQRRHIVSALKIVGVMSDVVWSMGNVYVAPLLLAAIMAVAVRLYLSVVLHLFGSAVPSGHLEHFGVSKSGGIAYLPVVRFVRMPGWASLGLILCTLSFYWLFELLYSLSRFSVSYAATVWYYCDDTESSQRDPGWIPSLQGLQMALQYYLGTNAFAGLFLGLTRPLKCLFFGSATRYDSVRSEESEALADYLGDSQPFRTFIDLLTTCCYVETAVNSRDFLGAVKEAASVISIYGWCPARRIIGTADFYTFLGVSSCSLTAAFLCFSSLTTLKEYNHVESPAFIGAPVTVSLSVGVASAMIVAPILCLWASLTDAILYSYILETRALDTMADPAKSQYAPYRLRALLNDKIKARMRSYEEGSSGPSPPPTYYY